MYYFFFCCYISIGNKFYCFCYTFYRVFISYHLQVSFLHCFKVLKTVNNFLNLVTLNSRFIFCKNTSFDQLFSVFRLLVFFMFGFFCLLFEVYPPRNLKPASAPSLHKVFVDNPISFDISFGVAFVLFDSSFIHFSSTRTLH